MRVFVASSWRNERQPDVVAILKGAGHDVYDFHNPPESAGFAWANIDYHWQTWTPSQYVDALQHDDAIAAFESDMDGLEEADAVVMVQPCGVSAALELGYAVGAGKHTAVLFSPGEPDLMLKMAGRLCLTIDELIDHLHEIEEGA